MEKLSLELLVGSSGVIKTANLGESADTHSWNWSGDTFTVNYSYASIATKTGLTEAKVKELLTSGKMIPYTSNFRGRSTTDSCKWMQYLQASVTSTGIKASIFCSGFSTEDEITWYFNTYVAWIAE